MLLCYILEPTVDNYGKRNTTYIYMKQDKNSMMSLSTSFIITTITQPKFSTTLRPPQWYNVNRQDDNMLISS